MLAQRLLLKKIFVPFSTLILIVVATAMFPRVITAVGVPSIANFLHFGTVTLMAGLVLPNLGGQFATKIIIGLFALLLSICASALSNGAGVINVLLSFLLLAEPFMLLLTIVGLNLPSKGVQKLKLWITLFAGIHIFFAYVQYFVLGWGHHDPDEIKGVFLGMDAGHHVGGAIAITAACYLFFSFTFRPIWIKAILTLWFLYEIILSDAKQVIGVFLAASVILVLTKVKDIGKFFRYLALTLFCFVAVYWAANTIFPALSLIFQTERLVNGVTTKFSVFSIIASYYHSPLNGLFGLGPGHTVSRLGWLIPDYLNYLQPLGVSEHREIFDAVFTAQQENYFTNSKTGSSLFSPLFSWAGVWGDLGWFGLTVYIYLWWLVWRFCPDDLSRFFLLTIFVFGVTFAWMEEPGYMLFTISLIGIQAQENKFNSAGKGLQIYLMSS